ncbi:MAG: hypothetical protein JXB10_12800 [Pirellulales bacterium]|nr:hypothetical protein [Pirellulales bacterium]
MFQFFNWALGSSLGWLVLVSTVWATGPGGYGNLPYAWIRAGDYETEEQVLFDTASYQWDWGGSEIIGEAYALGDITSPQYATAKAKSTIYYHDPYGSGALSIGADVETWKPFLVVSDTLSPGTQVNVWLELSYSGLLMVQEGVDDKYCYANASGEITLYDDLGTILAARDGSAEVECELIDGESELMTETSGYWDGKLTQVEGTEIPTYNLSYSETIFFTATVESRYWLYFDLTTGANSSAGSGLGWDGSATFAQADFSNTGSYTLGSDADVEFLTVPEPSLFALAVSLAIAAIAFFGLKQYRR